MGTVTVDEFVTKLSAIAPRDFTIPRVLEFTKDNPVKPDTLSPYLFYANSHYTRNLIFKCELFEVMAICWEIGQVSRIHNHRGQNCWMTAPIGRLRVQNFEVRNRDESSGTCALLPTDHYDMDASNPGVVQPEQPVHQVQNLPEFGERATSIHIYSYPYSTCEVYLMDRGTYSDVPLHYSSEYGKLSPNEKLM